MGGVPRARALAHRAGAVVRSAAQRPPCALLFIDVPSYCWCRLVRHRCLYIVRSYARNSKNVSGSMAPAGPMHGAAHVAAAAAIAFRSPVKNVTKFPVSAELITKAGR